MACLDTWVGTTSGRWTYVQPSQFIDARIPAMKTISKRNETIQLLEDSIKDYNHSLNDFILSFGQQLGNRTVRTIFKRRHGVMAQRAQHRQATFAIRYGNTSKNL